jgi:hypothetical protein
MKKVAVFTFLLIFFAVTVIANTPLDSIDPVASGTTPDSSSNQAPADPLRSRAPIPAPSTLLLIGSGLIGLIIYRKRFKDQK